jgi:hypothetical protein
MFEFIGGFGPAKHTMFPPATTTLLDTSRPEAPHDV